MDITTQQFLMGSAGGKDTYWITKILFSPVAGISGAQGSFSFASNGDIIIAAAVDGAGGTPVLRMTDAGVVSWCKSLFLATDGYSYSKMNSALVLSNGYILNYGPVYDYDYSARSGGIAMYDGSGNLQYQREIYLNETNLFLNSVLQLSNGNLMYGGNSTYMFIMSSDGLTNVTGRQEYRIIPGGNSTAFSPPDNSNGWAITSGSYIYMYGYVANYNSGTGGYDYYPVILITDTSLNFSSSYYYSVSGFTGTRPIYPLSFAKSSSGYYFCFTTNADNYLAYLTYTTSSGVQWTKTISTGYTRGRGYWPLVATDSSDNGYIMFYDAAQTTATIFKFDTSGAIVWKRDLTGLSNSYTLSDLKVVNNVLYAFVGGILAKLALNGTGTGTYGSYTYAESSKTYSTGPTVTQISGTGANYTTSYTVKNFNKNFAANTVTPTVTQYLKS